MRFTSRFDPRAGAADLWEYLREPRPYRWPILAVSIAIPLAGVAMLTQESHFRPPDAPKVNFISTFAEGRSDEEIRQSNLVNQQRKETREAEREELRARKLHDVSRMIQAGYRSYRARVHYLELREKAQGIFQGKKRRRVRGRHRLIA